MPVTRQATISNTLTNIAVDMTIPSIRCTFQQTIDGAAGSTPEFTLEGAAFMALLGATPAAGKSRGDDITDAIYEYALANGFLQGEVS